MAGLYVADFLHSAQPECHLSLLEEAPGGLITQLQLKPPVSGTHFRARCVMGEPASAWEHKAERVCGVRVLLFQAHPEGQFPCGPVQCLFLVENTKWEP